MAAKTSPSPAPTTTKRQFGGDDPYDPAFDQDLAAKDQKRLLRQSNDRAQAAYHAGRRGHPLPQGANPDEHMAWESGIEQHQQRTQPAQPAQPAPAPSGGGGGGWSLPGGSSSIELGHQGASLLLGAFAYLIGIQWLRGGWSQVTEWFGAKFWNAGSSLTSSSSTSSGTAASAGSAGTAAAPVAGNVGGNVGGTPVRPGAPA